MEIFHKRNLYDYFSSLEKFSLASNWNDGNLFLLRPFFSTFSYIVQLQLNIWFIFLMHYDFIILPYAHYVHFMVHMHSSFQVVWGNG